MNNTFLHEAAYAGNIEAMREALEDFKIRVTITNVTGDTAIHHLSISQSGTSSLQSTC
jgi:hypothetical protein